MNEDNELPKRRSVRLENYDYSNEGAYFVTICIQDINFLLGKIVNEKIALNKFGKIVKEEWFRGKAVRSYVDLDEFVIMPNHIHGIIAITENVGATRCVARVCGRATHRGGPKKKNKRTKTG
ncbi:MAG: hypothetical protein E3J72_17330 [Planctomycetota bacterium]|nr:MAG: hypothetical protein E3J72_17330 [Planctomycetota bacterium]